MDEQIALARAAGLNVILTTWHFPRWANGTAGVAADWAREDRGGPNTPIERLKPLEWRVPAGQLGPRGSYGEWLGWLMDRYAGYGRGLTLEIMNEPNGHLWPQQGPSHSADPYGAGPPVMPRYVTEMMATAQALSAERGHRIGLAGPALSDRVRADDRLFTSVRSLVPPTLAGLEWLGLPATPSFAWSHHNYWDIERGVALPGGAGDLARMLRGRWMGRGGPAAPRILDDGGRRAPGLGRRHRPVASGRARGGRVGPHECPARGRALLQLPDVQRSHSRLRAVRRSGQRRRAATRVGGFSGVWAPDSLRP